MMAEKGSYSKTKKRRLLNLKKIVLCCITFLIATSLFSRPQPDIQLTEVDALIEERRINEALALVEDYMKANPDDFDNAQIRVKTIFEARNAYKAKADELVRIIVEEPLNDKLKLDIIAELEAMEQNPNEEEREFIARIKVTSQFTYFRALYEQIIEDGTNLLNQKNYTASAQRFTDGFELYFEDFFERGFETSLVRDAIENLNIVNESVESYAQAQTDILQAFEQFNIQLSNNNAPGALNQYANVVQSINEFAEIRNEAIQVGFYFEEQTNLLQSQDPELTDAFFLAFAFRVILGRGNDSEANMVKAMDTQWHDLYEQTKLNFSSILEYYTRQISQSLQASTIAQISQNDTFFINQLETLQSLIDIGQDFLAQNELLYETQDTFKVNPYSDYENLLNFNTFLVAQSNSLIDSSNIFTEGLSQVSSYPLPASPGLAIQTSNTAYTDFLTNYANDNVNYATVLQTSISSTQQELALINENVASYGESEMQLYPALTALTQTLFTQFQNLSDQNYTESRTAWETTATFIADGSASIRSGYENPYNQAIPLINEEGDITIQSNPQEALVLLEEINQNIDTDILTLQNRLDFLNTSPQDDAIGINTSTVFSSDREGVAQDIAYLSGLSTTAIDYITIANQRVRLAQQAQNEADLRFEQAQEYLDQQNFAASRDALQRSRTKYNEALSYQYTAALQTQSDEDLAALGAEISFIENEIIVQNVRTFITQSRDSYYNSDFAQAESLILQAEAQWAITNIQENPEIITLKALIGNALSITTGRTIPPTDPLYPEMSQTLNVAYQHYDNAENLLDRNNRTQALGELELARNKIRDVQVLYPFHQEASLLALQIDQLIDPVAFENQFEQKFEQAQEDYQDTDTSARAYIDLLDLYEINPDYPGLEDFIYVVELELGIQLPPPNLAAIAQSNTLAQQAEAIYDSGARDEISLNNALALLNEAIELNADNQTALVLLDRINTSLGGAAVIVLSSEAENLYQQAVQQLANGNTITAAALVTQLLQLPGVQNSSKIIDLQRRVDSLL